MKLQGTYKLECGLEIINPTLEIVEIRQHPTLNVCYVDIRLSVQDCIFATTISGYTFEGENYTEQEIGSWVLNKIEEYRHE